MTGAPTGALPVITADCRGCGACLLTCPEHAIRPATRPQAQAHSAARLVVLDESCTRCGECVEVCPVDAVRLPPVTTLRCYNTKVMT